MISLAMMLEWKYGPVAGTRQKTKGDKSANPEMFISSWNHPDISKPSSSQIKKDMKEYKEYIKKQKLGKTRNKKE